MTSLTCSGQDSFLFHLFQDCLPCEPILFLQHRPHGTVTFQGTLVRGQMICLVTSTGLGIKAPPVRFWQDHKVITPLAKVTVLHLINSSGFGISAWLTARNGSIFFYFLIYENMKHINVSLSIIRQLRNGLPEWSKWVCKCEIKVRSILKVNNKKKWISI